MAEGRRRNVNSSNTRVVIFNITLKVLYCKGQERVNALGKKTQNNQDPLPAMHAVHSCNGGTRKAEAGQ
jgi:hypothetical protein